MVYVNPTPNQRKSMLRKLYQPYRLKEMEEHVFVRVFRSQIYSV